MKILIWIVAIIIAGTCVLTTVEAAASGSEINQLTVEKEKLSEEQLSLSRELVESSSLGSISTKAEALGFVKPEKTVYISREPEFAAR